MSEIRRAQFIEVDAGVRYWEDAEVDGGEDADGNIHGRNADRWKVIIDLDLGFVEGWPPGSTANIHYKVCDDGEYWLLDGEKRRIARWAGHYVPDKILCIGDTGYGDYIILEIDGHGRIKEWKRPTIDASEWQPT